MKKRIYVGLVLLSTFCSARAQEDRAGSVDSASHPWSVPASMVPLFDRDTPYTVRCRFVTDLKGNLQSDEINALLQFVGASPKDVGLRRDLFNSVGDKVLSALERQRPVSPELAEVLIVMYRNEENDFTWRDYCIQHLGSIYAQKSMAEKRGEILGLWNDALAPETRMAGAAVLAMYRNVGKAGITVDYVSSRAGRVALDGAQPDFVRLTAIQVAAELKNQEMLPLSRSLVESRIAVPVRISAMAAIGLLGNASDLPLLRKYVDSSDMRLRIASSSAIEKIERREKSEPAVP